MKNTFIIILFLLFGITQSKAQVWVNGVEYPFTGTNSGPQLDPGTPHFSYDAAPTLVGGLRFLNRKGGYWYLYTTGIGITYGSTYFLTARTTVPQTDPTVVGPPDCAQWQLYSSPMGSPGFTWTGYPTTTPPPPNGTFTTINITGSMVVSGSAGTSTNVLPDYLELSTKSTTTIAGYSNYGGRLLYNNCDNAVMYNNGSAWKAMWPNNLHYDLQADQRFNFINSNTSIYGRYSFSNPNQLVLSTNNTPRIILDKDNTTNSSQINIKGSVTIPVKTVSINYTLSDDDYSIVYNGSGPSHIITLPNPSTTPGRTLIIANKATVPVILSPAIHVYGSSLGDSQSLILLSDGTDWLKIN